jgi:hypothetical protein
MMGRHSPAASLTEVQRKRIVAAIAAGVAIKTLVRSGRFRGVTDQAMARLADEAGVERKRWSRKDCP